MSRRSPQGVTARARTSDPSTRWFAALALLGFAWTVTCALGLAVALRHLKHLVDESDSHESRTSPASVGVPSASVSATSARPGDSTTPRALPRETRTTSIGAIELVTLGADAPDLRTAIRNEVVKSQEAGRALIVFVSDEDDCAPCRGVRDALVDPAMQAALGRTRLVLVDRNAFQEELDGLGLRVDVHPMFLRFDESLSLLDAIHGGEWDEDIAVNIAPVLGAFSHGNYRARRNPAWTPARRGQRL